MKAGIFAQLAVIIILFFSIWLLLSRIDWVGHFSIDQMDEDLEEKLGKLVWESIKGQNEICQDSLIVTEVENIANKITSSNNIDFSKLKIHILQQDEINAFALPDNHLVILTGLLEFADKPEEIAGVIAHELVHLEKNHVMKKLVKEIGVSLLLGATTGNSGIGTISEVARMLSSSFYDRKLETEADLIGVEYLENAGIDPHPLADFMYKMSLENPDIPNAFFWISSHPDSKERSQEISSYISTDSSSYTPLMDSIQWKTFTEAVQSEL